LATDSKELVAPEPRGIGGCIRGTGDAHFRTRTENWHSCALRALAEEFGAEQVSTDARSLAERISEGRFYVACIGQFKRGKSSILNALVGESVYRRQALPTRRVRFIYIDTYILRVVYKKSGIRIRNHR